MGRQSSNALELAEWLTDPQTACATKVKEVHYPGLSSHPQHQLCKEQMRTGGAVGTVRLSAEDGASEQQQLAIVQRFTAALKLFVLAESLGGVESMVNHSATMSHGGMERDERAAIGVFDTTLRLSIGLEDLQD